MSISSMLVLIQSRYNTILEDDLSLELENGRLFRLICKLGYVNERPE